MRLEELQDVVLIKSVEWCDRTGAVLPIDERRKATNEALRLIGVDGGQVDDDLTIDLISKAIADRASRLTSNLKQRHPVIDEVLALSGWRTWAGWIALISAVVAGVAAGLLSGVQRVLALPFMLVIIWNFGVYALTAWFALRSRIPGVVHRKPALMVAVHSIGRRLSSTFDQVAKVDKQIGDVCQRFASEWRIAAGPLLAQQLRLVLHLCSVAFCLAMIAAFWLSLNTGDPSPDCTSEQNTLKRLLLAVNDLVRPLASRFGLELPAKFCDPSDVTGGNGLLTPYLNFGAVMLFILVIVPRLGLAALAAYHLRQLESPSCLSPDIEAYARGALFRTGSQKVISILAFPYGNSLRSEFETLLQRECLSSFGPGAAVEIRPVIAIGNEQAIADAIERSAGLVAGYVVASEIGITPKRDEAGLLLTIANKHANAIGKGVPIKVIIDDFELKGRFRPQWWHQRRQHRHRRAWRELSEARGVPVVFLSSM